MIRTLETENKKKQSKIVELLSNAPKPGLKRQNLDLIEKNRVLKEDLKNNLEQMKTMRAEIHKYEAKYTLLNNKIGSTEYRGKIKMTIAT